MWQQLALLSFGIYVEMKDLSLEHDLVAEVAQDLTAPAGPRVNRGNMA